MIRLASDWNKAVVAANMAVMVPILAAKSKAVVLKWTIKEHRNNK